MQLPDMLQHVVFKQLPQHPCKDLCEECKGHSNCIKESSIKRMYGNTAAIRAGVESHPTERPSSSTGHLSTATIDAFQLNLTQQEV